MPNYIIDTYAWIEYFRGTENGVKIKEKIDADGNITPTIVLAELKKKYVGEGVCGFDEDLRFIKNKSIVIPLDEHTALVQER
jgi:predicted nucleic acid-binding protein